MNRLLCFALLAASAFAGDTMRELEARVARKRIDGFLAWREASERELSPGAQKPLRQRLHNTRLQKVAFDRSTVRDAIEFVVTMIRGTEADFGLTLRVEETSEDDTPVSKRPPAKLNQDGIPGLEAPFGFLPEPAGPKITYHATNVPVDEILDEICRQAKLQWKLTLYGVLITRPPSKTRSDR